MKERVLFMDKSQKIGLIAAISICMNGMIGAGIFTVPTKLIAQAGPAGLLTYIFVTIAVWFIALTLSRVAERYPLEGSFYTYAKQWGGHTIGLVAAGSYITGLVIALGLLAGIAGSYVHAYIPALSASILSYALIIAVTVLSITGLRITQLGQYILVLCTIIPIMLTTFVCLSHARFEHFSPFAPFGLLTILTASKAVIFGFFGFECAASLFTLIEHPEKNVPKALTYSLVAVSGLYICFIASLILAFPATDFSYAAQHNLPLTAVLAPLFVGCEWMLSIITFSITTALIGVLYAMTFSCGQLLASLSRRCKNEQVHMSAKSGTLFIALGIVASFLTLHDADLFFSLTSIFILAAFMMSMLSLFFEKKYRVTTTVALLTSSLIFACAAHDVWNELSKRFVFKYTAVCPKN